ncbi:MAG: hypothetical protein LBQ13_01240 [Endomicrobium sp.]|jgi:uncharacterized membrane protein|nr:hypothetical protein [Endomicrobium sp.]
MMKKYSFTIPIILIIIISTNAFCLRNYVERIDYFIEFHEKSPEMAAVLRINFINFIPESKEAEEVVKYQLERYGNMLVTNNKMSATVENENKYKNIIGSAWYINDENPTNHIKIKFQNDLAAYVWIGKTRTVIPFPKYMSFLKKEKKNRKFKDKKHENNTNQSPLIFSSCQFFSMLHL